MTGPEMQVASPRTERSCARNVRALNNGPYEPVGAALIGPRAPYRWLSTGKHCASRSHRDDNTAATQRQSSPGVCKAARSVKDCFQGGGQLKTGSRLRIRRYQCPGRKRPDGPPFAATADMRPRELVKEDLSRGATNLTIRSESLAIPSGWGPRCAASGAWMLVGPARSGRRFAVIKTRGPICFQWASANWAQTGDRRSSRGTPKCSVAWEKCRCCGAHNSRT